MEDELDRIIGYFSLDPEEKEKKLENVFSDSVEYFARFKHIMENGTPEEKKQAAEKIMLLKQIIEKETQRVCEKTGMSIDQLNEYSNNPQNYTEKQWELIQNAKSQLQKDAAEAALSRQKNSSSGSNGTSSQTIKKKAPRKKTKKPKGWIQS